MVFVGCNQRQCGEFADYLLIYLVNARHIDDRTCLSLFGKFLPDRKGLRNEAAVCDNGAVRSIGHDVHFAVPEGVIAGKIRLVFLFVYDGPPVPAGRHEEIAFCCRYVTDHPVRLVRVARHDHRCPVQAPHEADVIDALVGLAVRPNVEADVGDNGFEIRIVYVIDALLVVYFIDPEHTEISKKCQYPPGGHGPGDRRRVMLLDAALEKIVGVCLRKICRFHGTCEVTIERSDRAPVRYVPVANILQGLAERGAVIDLVRFVVGKRRAGVYRLVKVFAVKAERPLPFSEFPVIFKSVLEAEDGHCLFVFRRVERAAVIFFLVFHKGDAVAHDRVRHDADRIFPVIPRVPQGGIYFLVIVTVCDLDDVPSVGKKILHDILRHDEIDAAADLEPVIIDEDRYIRQAVFARETARLRDLPFLLFAVAHKHVYVGRTGAQPGCHGKTRPCGEPLPQVACRPLYKGDPFHNMAFERTSRSSEKRHDLIDGHVAQACKAGISAR